MAKLPKADGGGLRFDADKPRPELLPVEWIEGLTDVMTRGAMKYAERNWERGMPRSKMIGCAFRHVFKWLKGERYDKETGCHHLFMASWNLMGLASYDLRDIGEKDLPDTKLKFPLSAWDLATHRKVLAKAKKRK